MNLTKPQQLIYDMDRFAGGTIAVICGSILIDSNIDINKLKSAVNEICRLNDALRIRVSDADGVSQNISGYKELDIPVLTFNSKAEFTAFADDYAKQPIDIAKSLCEMQIVALPEQSGILIKLHHLIGDAWTLSLLGNQLSSILNGETVEAFSYADYVEAEQAYMQSRRYEKDKSFFMEQFKKCDEVTYLSEKSSDNYRADRKTFVIDKAQAKLITDYATNNETSAFTLFTTALSAYISRIKMNAERFYIGTAVLNRSTYKEKNTAGMFINTIPMLMEIDSNKFFAETCSSVEDTVLACFRHQKFNYGNLLENLRSEFKFNEKLYDVMISYQNASITANGFESAWYHSGMQTESLQIHIDDRDNEGVFRIHYDYLTDKFTEHQIEMMHGHIYNLLLDAISDSTKKICQLNILSETEKNTLLYDFNDTSTKYESHKCVHTLFEERVVKIPDKTAVIAQDKTLTYSQLNSQANRIAHSLIEKGIKPNDIVAFMLPRKSYLLSAIFGILKSGACYMPIDPDYPQDRIDYMLKDSKAKFCITEDNIQNLFNNEHTNNPNIKLSSDNLCYCIYTSGSTGNPKGVLIKHSNIVNLILHATDFDNSDYKIALLTTITFDVASQEIFTALLNGLSGYLFAPKNTLSIGEVIDIITENNIDVLFATPSYFDALTQNEVCAAKLLSQLKYVILAGENFYLNNTVQANLKLIGTKYLNQYGPAETHVVSSAEIIKESLINTIKIKDLSVTNSKQENLVIQGFNNTSISYNKEQCAHTLFEAQATMIPNKVAVVACDKTLTYSELNNQANRIAHSLIEKGIKPNDIVAFMLPRKSYLLSVLFGILKTGACYMPIDPDYPQDRIDYMLEDSKAKLCITEDSITDMFNNNNKNNYNPDIEIASDSPCYCIYTSGSTGKPKGTVLTHANVVNYCDNNNNNNVVHSIIKETYKSIVSVTTVGFDIFVTESILPLTNGMQIVLANEDQAKIQKELNQLLLKTPVDVLQTTPTKMKSLISDKEQLEYLKSLKVIILGGEALDEALVEQLKQLTDAEIFNIYGPTETTVWVTNAKIK